MSTPREIRNLNPEEWVEVNCWDCDSEKVKYSHMENGWINLCKECFDKRRDKGDNQ